MYSRRLLQTLLLAFLIFSSQLRASQVCITCESPLFENDPPTFTLEHTAETPKRLCIQLADHPDFLDEDLIFEEVGPYTETYCLPELAEKSLHNGNHYYIRSRVMAEDQWEEWSSPTPFQILRVSAYTKPDHIEEDVWNRVEPHLLPEDHPIKPVLDKIFSESRAILGIKSLKKAGFIKPFARKWTHLVVTRHPDVPGYIFKLYLDAQRYFKGKKEYDHWLERIEGVTMIKTEIQKRGWTDTFKTPIKWIYALPAEPSPPKEFKRKNFILVEQDMDILGTQENYDMWKSEAVTEELLTQFYTICEELGLHDCAKPDNAPFSRDGKIAFIDTQTFYYWPVLYKKMTPYLSKERQTQWKALTKGSRK